MKKALSLFLTIMLVFSLIPTTAFAASTEATHAADVLNALGLFDGTGIDENGNPIYALDKVPTRLEAVTMLVRLLGKSEEAVNGNWDTPFTDVANWAKPYVGYAYANGLASGTSKTTFGGNDKVTAAQYITFVLRALGYESGVDFTWNKAWELSDEIGLTDGRYDEKTESFLRSDIAITSASALNSALKNSNMTMFENMKNNGQLDAKATITLASQKLNYSIRHDNGHYGKYILDANVTKIGERYQFEFLLLPNYFSKASFFPVGYNNEGDNKYVRFISFDSKKDVDIAIFSVSEEFIFNNPVNRWNMILSLSPILTAFPDDFVFPQNSLSPRIHVTIDTSQLPR